MGRGRPTRYAVDLAADQAVSAGVGQPGESSDQPATVAVCRSGGFAGTTKVGQLDLNADPEGRRSDIC